MTAPSSTEANPVTNLRECVPCRVTLSGNHLPDGLLALWEAAHADHEGAA